MSRMNGEDIQAFPSDHLLALAWQAEKRKVPVIMLSSNADPKQIPVQSSNHHIPLSSKPAVVDSYNQYMNGVDVADQLGVYYAFQCKTLSGGRRCFFGYWKSLLSTAI